VNKILRAGNHHEKEYLVTVNKPLTPEFLKGMAGGVPILDTVTKPCTIEQTGKCSFKIILTQGLNRQIRRMCEYFGYRVEKLERVRIMNIKLGDLKSGQYREITGAEYAKLMKLTEDSSSAPIDYENRSKKKAAPKKEGKLDSDKKHRGKETQPHKKKEVKKEHKIYIVQNRNLD
jgi:23S rRNA pseudouridine2604 synthase